MPGSMPVSGFLRASPTASSDLLCRMCSSVLHRNELCGVSGSYLRACSSSSACSHLCRMSLSGPGPGKFPHSGPVPGLLRQLYLAITVTGFLQQLWPTVSVPGFLQSLCTTIPVWALLHQLRPPAPVTGFLWRLCLPIPITSILQPVLLPASVWGFV